MPVLTLDGAGATGKGTLGLRLADWLGWHFLDSGAFYRALALCALEAGLKPGDERRLVSLAESMELSFKTRDGSARVFLGTREVTAKLRREEVGRAASINAAQPTVRAALLETQRTFLRPPGLVADGRDMGTVVFPRAPLKFYLTASQEQRTLRRHHQLKEMGLDASMAHIGSALSERDQRDGTRTAAPMRPAPDAIFINTTELGRDEVFACAERWVRRRFQVPATEESGAGT